jgi:hypothetical protein
MIQQEAPLLPGDPNRTFVVGGTRDYLAISTAGRHAFIGQHPLWSETGALERALLFDGLTLTDVSRILAMFDAGRAVRAASPAFTATSNSTGRIRRDPSTSWPSTIDATQRERAVPTPLGPMAAPSETEGLKLVVGSNRGPALDCGVPLPVSWTREGISR